MKIFSDIASKLIWLLIVAVLLGIGYVWALNSFLKPPKVVDNPTPVPTPALTPSLSPTPDVPTQASPRASTPTSAATPQTTVANNNSSPVASSDSNPSPQPALALPEEVVLKAPEKLEKGGVLKLYYNNDNSRSPDPIQYSPSKILKTPGLSFLNVNDNNFQEASGYFLVEQTGNYNFAISHPDIYLELKQLRTKIDGSVLPSTKGGRVALERGWHQVSIFLNNSYIDANLVNVSWGKEEIL